MSAFERLEAGLLSAIEARDQTSQARPPRRPERRLALGVATGLLAGAAVAVAAFLPTSGPGPAQLLSPQAAVAAAAADLNSDGILEWTDLQGEQVEDPSLPGTTTTRWVDLRTGDSSGVQRQTFVGRAGRPRTALVWTWSVGRTSWLDEGQVSKKTGKRIVRKTVVRRPPIAERYRRTPVDQVRRDLARAAAGKLPIKNAGEIDGVPVVEILDVRREFTRRIWISKEASPRLMRATYRMPLPGGLPGDPTVSELKTLVWKIHPRSPKTLAKIRPAPFDPAKHTVITTYRK